MALFPKKSVHKRELTSSSCDGWTISTSLWIIFSSFNHCKTHCRRNQSNEWLLSKPQWRLTYRNIHHILSRMYRFSLNFEHYRKLKVLQKKMAVNILTAATVPTTVPHITKPHPQILHVSLVTLVLRHRALTKPVLCLRSGSGDGIYTFSVRVFVLRELQKGWEKQYVISSLGFKTHDELLDSKTKTSTGSVGAGGCHRKFICLVTC